MAVTVFVRTCVLALALATSLQAQERDRRRGEGGRSRGQAPAQKEPTYWMTVGTGLALLDQVDDGNTQSLWDFGQAFPLTFAIERVVGSSVSAGIAGSYSRVPLVYVGSANGCTQCDAHATVATYGAVVLSGGVGSQAGVYQLFRLFLGAIQYGNFEQDSPRQALPPDGANIDFLFSAGYGFGYAIARDWRVELTGESTYSIHERDKLPGNAQTLSRHYVIGLGLRVGF